MVQSVVREAFQLVEKHLFTVNGLPNTLERAAITRNALVNGANVLLFPLMAQRIMSDSKYRKDLSSLVTSYIFFKKLITNAVITLGVAVHQQRAVYHQEKGRCHGPRRVWPQSKSHGWWKYFGGGHSDGSMAVE